MAGTRASALKARETIKETYGDDFYANIGRKGGSRCVSKGFGKNKELASSAGRKGGKISKRGRMTKRSIDVKPKDTRPYWQQILDEIRIIENYLHGIDRNISYVNKKPIIKLIENTLDAIKRELEIVKFYNDKIEKTNENKS